MGATLHIRAASDPQTLPRILGLFSQRWVVPSAFVARRDGDMLDIRCHVPDLPGSVTAIVVAKLRGIVLVVAVEVVAEP